MYRSISSALGPMGMHMRSIKCRLVPMVSSRLTVDKAHETLKVFLDDCEVRFDAFWLLRLRASQLLDVGSHERKVLAFLDTSLLTELHKQVQKNELKNVFLVAFVEQCHPPIDGPADKSLYLESRLLFVEVLELIAYDVLLVRLFLRVLVVLPRKRLVADFGRVAILLEIVAEVPQLFLQALRGQLLAASLESGFLLFRLLRLRMHPLLREFLSSAVAQLGLANEVVAETPLQLRTAALLLLLGDLPQEVIIAVVLFHDVLGLDQSSLQMLLRPNYFDLFVLDPATQTFPFLVVSRLVDTTVL